MPAVEQEPCPELDMEPGYRALWDGRSLDGWHMAGPGGFDIVRDPQDDRCALESVGGMGLLWHEDELGRYTLRLDFKVFDERDNSGVFIGFPGPGDDPWVAVNRGYEVQIDTFGAPAGDPINQTGAIYNVQPPTAFPAEVGEWNTMEITVVAPSVTVRVNGVLVNEFTSTDPDRDLSSGHVGIQNHGPGDTVQFRNIRVRED